MDDAPNEEIGQLFVNEDEDEVESADDAWSRMEARMREPNSKRSRRVSSGVDEDEDEDDEEGDEDKDEEHEEHEDEDKDEDGNGDGDIEDEEEEGEEESDRQEKGEDQLDAIRQRGMPGGVPFPRYVYAVRTQTQGAAKAHYAKAWYGVSMASSSSTISGGTCICAHKCNQFVSDKGANGYCFGDHVRPDCKYDDAKKLKAPAAPRQSLAKPLPDDHSRHRTQAVPCASAEASEPR
jgi:hypothetical protein